MGKTLLYQMKRIFDEAKNSVNFINEFLLFIFLAVFPFGQLFGKTLDIVVGIIFLYTIAARLQFPKVSKYFKNFILTALFSFLLSLVIFKSNSVLIGGLYLLRLVIYCCFAVFCLNYTKGSTARKKLVFNSLILVSIASVVFGWIQYLFYPDLRTLVYLGWDDHLYRLVGTFLDPGFTSLIIVLGIILSFSSNIILPLFLIVTLAFTYSRAGYLAFLGAMIFMAFLTKKVKKVILLVLFLGVVIWFLPRPAGQGINLARTYSISARLQNYIETLKIAKESPIFGIGFNNICLAKEKYLGKKDLESHSCSGSDSSLLLILATTGIVGLLIFVYGVIKMINLVSTNSYGKIFLVSLVALFIHSFFVNSLFYSWIMGFFAILSSLLSFKEKS